MIRAKKLGRPDEALRFYREAEAAFRALYGSAELLAALNAQTDAGSPPAEEWANHNIANVFMGRGLVYQRQGDFAAMRHEAQASIAMRQDNLQRNPTNAIWRQSLMFDNNYLSLALLQLNEPVAAFAAAQQAWDAVHQRLSEEGSTPLWTTTRRNFAPQYAQALLANGRPREAIEVLEPSLEFWRGEAGAEAARKVAQLQAHLDAARVALVA